METVKNIMMEALKNGACSKSYGVSDWKTLCWLFFTPQGMEFCEDNNFPTLEMFQRMSGEVENYNVFVDKGKVIRNNDSTIALIGDTQGELVFDDNTKVHKVILMHNAEARIVARNYAVVRIVNIGGCKALINKDKTSVILR